MMMAWCWTIGERERESPFAYYFIIFLISENIHCGCEMTKMSFSLETKLNEISKKDQSSKVLNAQRPSIMFLNHDN